MPKRTVRQRVLTALKQHGTPPVGAQPTQQQVHDMVTAYRRRRERAEEQPRLHRRAIIHHKKAPSSLELGTVGALPISLPVAVARCRAEKPSVLAAESRAERSRTGQSA